MKIYLRTAAFVLLVSLTCGHATANSTFTPEQPHGCTSVNAIGNVPKRPHDPKKQFIAGHFWSEEVEDKVRTKNVNFSVISLDELRFVDVQPGCGRMKNRLLITSNGDLYCARYRNNMEQLQGEFSSYLLAKLLSIDNVPTPLPVQVEPFSPTWSQVWFNLECNGWRPQAVVILTKWIEGLRPVNAPKYLLKEEETDSLTCSDMFDPADLDEAAFLLWWTDMIIFDYVTGNLDRLVNHMYNLHTSDKNALLLPIHNLKKTREGRLLFLDNESGFGHSYRMMSLYQTYHKMSLGRICVLQKSTFQRLRYLSELSESNIEEQLYENIDSELIPRLKTDHLMTMKRRIMTAYDHFVSNCKIT